MVIAIGAAEQDTYPPRVLVSLTGLAGTEAVEVYRVVAGARTLLRAGYDTVDDVAFLVLDAELPFGVPVSYVAVVDSVDEYSTSATTYTLAGGKVALTDAITAQVAEVVILSWPERRYDRDASVFRASNGRTVVVSGPAGQFTGTIELFVDSDSSRRNVQTLLDGATANTIQIRQDGLYDDVDCYVSVLSYAVRRFSQDGTDPRRVIALEVAEVEAWDDSLAARGYTLQDLADVYTGLTLDDVAGDFATLLDLAQAELIP